MTPEAPPIELDAQYRAMREEVGLLARPERAFLEVRGAEAAEYLQGQLTQDIEVLEPGEGAYAALLDRKGHLIADARVLVIAADRISLDTDAGALEPLRKHLSTYKIGRAVEVEVPDPAPTLLSLIGPRAAAMAGVDPPGPEHSHRQVGIGGSTALAVSTEAGVDLIPAAGAAEALAEDLVRMGAGHVTEAAAEIIRIESGRPRFGHELSNEVMPAEAGIVERAVSFTKGCYIGQEPVARLHYRGRPNRHLRGLVLSGPAEPGSELTLDGKVVGRLGTAGISPAIGPVGLAIVRREAEPGTTVEVGGDGLTAEIRELPLRESGA